MRERTNDKAFFKFDGDDIKRWIQYDLNLMRRMGKSFNYVSDKLKTLGFHKEIKSFENFSLANLKFDEGKNYNWFYISKDNVHLIIRSYGVHHTVFVKRAKKRNVEIGDDEYLRITEDFGAFVFHTDTDSIKFDSDEEADKNSDYYHENPFTDLDDALEQIFTQIAKGSIGMMSNPYSVTRPEFCELKLVFYGETIISVDKLIFCGEELSNKHTELFSQNDVLDILKSLPKDTIGKKFGRETIREIVTKFPKQYSDPYYHGVGIRTKEGDKTNFHDVYVLSRYYYEELMKLVTEVEQPKEDEDFNNVEYIKLSKDK